MDINKTTTQKSICGEQNENRRGSWTCTNKNEKLTDIAREYNSK